jgi:hypothetical protein
MKIVRGAFPGPGRQRGLPGRRAGGHTAACQGGRGRAVRGAGPRAASTYRFPASPFATPAFGPAPDALRMSTAFR